MRRLTVAFIIMFQVTFVRRIFLIYYFVYAFSLLYEVANKISFSAMFCSATTLNCSLYGALCSGKPY